MAFYDAVVEGILKESDLVEIGDVVNNKKTRARQR